MTEPRDRNPFADRTPPAELQQRVATTLSRDGLVEPRSTRIRRTTSRAVVGLAAVALAFAAGRFPWQAPPVDGRPQFLFLLYEDSTYRDDRPTREIVAEYGGWADSLRNARVLSLGAKLGDGSAELPGRQRASRDRPTGLFIVQADDIASAAAIAGTSPHLRHGGRVVVHEIDHGR